MRGMFLLQLGKYVSAESELVHSLDMGAPDTPMLYWMGELYWKTGRYQYALDAFNEALRREPLNDCVWNSLGITYHRLGEVDSSLICFSKAIEINSDVGFYYVNRSFLHGMKRNRSAQAWDLEKYRGLTRSGTERRRPLVERGLLEDV